MDFRSLHKTWGITNTTMSITDKSDIRKNGVKQVM